MQQAVEKDPNNAILYYNLGLSMENKVNLKIAKNFI